MPIAAQFTANGPSIRLTGGIDMPLCLSLLDELNLLHSYYQFSRIELQIDSPGGEANALAFLVEELATWRAGNDRILRTVGLSEVSSAAAMLLSLGTKAVAAAMSSSSNAHSESGSTIDSVIGSKTMKEVEENQGVVSPGIQIWEPKTLQ